MKAIDNRKEIEMKKIKLAICAVFSFILLMSININVFAGEWKFDGPKEWQWWYRNDDGSYPHDTWSHINDKWYHFDSNGYLDVGYRKFDGKYYILEEHGDKIGQMRENEKHRSYSVAADGAVRIYNLTGYNDDYLNYKIEELRFDETGEKLFDVLKDHELYTGSSGSDYFSYTTGFRWYNTADGRMNEQDKIEDAKFFEKNYINIPSAYEVNVINKKEDRDIYDYIILIDLINDSFHESADYGSKVYEDEWGESNIGKFDYMDIGNNNVKLFYYY